MSVNNIGRRVSGAGATSASAAQITQDRRRLSMADPALAKDDGHYDSVAAAASLNRPENPRGLLNFLETKSLLETAGVQSQNKPSASGAASSAAGTSAGRDPKTGRRGSFSISGLTDRNQDSFEEKKVVSEHQEVMAHATSAASAAAASRAIPKDAELATEFGMGIRCKKGFKPEAPNQDSYCYVHAEGNGGFDLWGVFDGHGQFGHDVSNYAREMVPKLFMSDKLRDSDNPADIKRAMTAAFVKTQQLIEENQKLDARTSGSTATLGYMKRDGKNELYVAHSGDSRAVLVCRDEKGKPLGVELTPDHKPELPGERKRIEDAGGVVLFDGFYNHRVFKRGAAYPGLNMSRALGDVIGNKRAGISHIPDVVCIDLNKLANGQSGIGQTPPKSVGGLADGAPAATFRGFEFCALLLCSDGVWEFIDNNEAARMVLATSGKKSAVNRAGIDPAAAAEQLAKESWARWMDDTGGEVCDDICAMVQTLG